jgi:hypothetical protein
VLAVLGDEMRCVHYDRLTSGGPRDSNWGRGSHFAIDALCARTTSGSPIVHTDPGGLPTLLGFFPRGAKRLGREADH